MFPKHLISITDVTREQIGRLFTLAAGFEHTPPKGVLDPWQVICTLFYEPSTRTRISFESAALQMGGNVVSVADAKASSARKGETLADAVRVLSAYCDLIVLRHPRAGSAAEAAAVSRVPVINGGDGPRQHPTQTLLDLYTINKERGGGIEGARVALVGDLRFGRPAHSLALGLAKWPGIKLDLVSPRLLAMPAEILAALRAAGVQYRQTSRLEEVLSYADVFYRTRFQKERFKGINWFLRFLVKDHLRITRETPACMKPSALIMHPLPRVGEISPGAGGAMDKDFFIFG